MAGTNTDKLPFESLDKKEENIQDEIIEAASRLLKLPVSKKQTKKLKKFVKNELERLKSKSDRETRKQEIIKKHFGWLPENVVVGYKVIGTLPPPNFRCDFDQETQSRETIFRKYTLEYSVKIWIKPRGKIPIDISVDITYEPQFGDYEVDFRIDFCDCVITNAKECHPYLIKCAYTMIQDIDTRIIPIFESEGEETLIEMLNLHFKDSSRPSDSIQPEPLYFFPSPPPSPSPSLP